MKPSSIITAPSSSSLSSQEANPNLDQQLLKLIVEQWESGVECYDYSPFMKEYLAHKARVSSGEVAPYEVFHFSPGLVLSDLEPDTAKGIGQVAEEKSIDATNNSKEQVTKEAPVKECEMDRVSKPPVGGFSIGSSSDPPKANAGSRRTVKARRNRRGSTSIVNEKKKVEDVTLGIQKYTFKSPVRG